MVIDNILGLAAFDTLSAEHEKWILSVFIPPQDFPLLIEHRSFLIIGGRGTGKTAIRLAMEDRITNDPKQTNTMLLNWTPNPSEDNLRGSSLMRFATNQVFHAFVRGIFSTHSKEPARFEKLPAWAEDAISWLLRSYLPGDPNFYVESRGPEFGPETTKWALNLLERPFREILPKSAPTTEIIQLILITSESLGFSNLWVMVDGLEKLSTFHHAQAEDLLEAMLSTLSLFEEQGFVFKLFIPDSMESTLIQTRRIDRRRVHFYPLGWSETEIRKIVQERLSLATGKSQFSLEKLCSDQQFVNWLFRFGGTNPRIWLSIVTPFVDAYLRAGKSLNKMDWSEIAQKSPPKLRVDVQTSRVFIGDYELNRLSPNEYRILEYLYLNRHRICTREEIYYRCIQNLDQEPKPNDPTRLDEPIWRRSFDQALSRLRKVTEPFEDPIYIKTIKGFGIRLENYS